MALTPQEETVVRIIINSTIEAGFSDQPAYQAFLTRGRLEQELAELESEERNLRAGFAMDTGEFNDALAANQAAQAAKQDEIDAL